MRKIVETFVVLAMLVAIIAGWYGGPLVARLRRRRP